MTKKYDFLTKTKIQSGLQCPKKLWFDVHQPIKHKDKVAFRIGNLFGDHVKKGEVIGTVGSSGRATGPHLDIRLNWYDTRLDPNSVLNIK